MILYSVIIQERTTVIQFVLVRIFYWKLFNKVHIGVSSCYIEDSCISSFGVSGNNWLYESIPATVQVDDRSRECGFNGTKTTKIGSGCFSSTLKLLREQIKDFCESNYTVTKDIYLLCP